MEAMFDEKIKKIKSKTIPGEKKNRKIKAQTRVTELHIFILLWQWAFVF